MSGSIPVPPPGFVLDGAAPTGAGPTPVPPPPGFTLDGTGAAATAPAPAAVPPPPAGFALDDPRTGQPVQSLAQGPGPSLGERFVANVKAGFQGTLAGSAANYLAQRLAPDTVPFDPNTGQPMSGPTPREQVRQSVIQDQQDYAAMPGYGQEHGVVNQALAGGAALAGQIVGGAASPESLVTGPEGYGAIRAGEAALPVIAKSAGVQAVVQGAANTGAQGLNIASGTQDQFSVPEVAQAAGVGALIGAAHPVAGVIVNRVKGKLPEAETPAPVAPPTAAEPAAPAPPPGFVLDKPEPAMAQPVEAPAATNAGPATTPAAPTDQGTGAGASTPAPALPAGFTLDPPAEPAAPVPAVPAVPEPEPASPSPVLASPEPEPASPAPAPVPVDPNLGTVTTNAGRKVDVRYEVAPAKSLVPASGDLQPRERGDRLSSDAQIQNIAANLDPARLMRAPEADRGAPIVGPDNIIESGNGRVQAIQRAAEQNPEAYARYVQALKDAGHDTEGIDTPVLVARRTTEFSPEDRRAFVQEANQSATQRFSAGEQAKVDAGALTSNLLAKYDHTQDATSAANRPFVRDWVGTLPEAERNSVLDAQGQLSAEGVRRLNGAMLARAYDDPGVLARGLESTDDATRSVSGGLSDAAPAWARLRAGIESGSVPPEFDTSKNLTRAADIVRTAREKKQSMADVLAQQDAFNPIDPVTEQYVRALYNPAGTRAASRPAIGDVLRRYADEASKQSTETGLFGDAEKVKPVDALKAIMSRRDVDAGANGTGTQTSLLGNGTKLVSPEPARGGDRLAADDRPVNEELPFGDHNQAPTNATGPAATRAPIPGEITKTAGDFNRETSPYRQVFSDAGKDPDLMVSRPLPEQNKVITDHVKNTFGFKDVIVDPRQNPKEVRDQLSNFYQNAREMSAALGMPYKAIGLDGRLTFTTKPYRTPTQALGTYAPGKRALTIPGRSNSFAHEWTHALDHYLSDALAKNPAAMKMLSLTKGIASDPVRVGGRIVGPNSPAETFADVMATIWGKDAPTAAEALRLQFAARSPDVKIALAATRRLEQIQSDFARNAKALPGPKGYFDNPAELLARAHEAYVSEMIQRQGGDTRAVVKPTYEAQTKGDLFDRLYPQGPERDHIFQKFTELHDRLRAQTILGPGVGERPNGLGMVDPRVWDRVADPTQDPKLWADMRRGANVQKTLWGKMKSRVGMDGSGAEPGPKLGIGTRVADVGRELTYSIRGIGEALTKRQPGDAKNAFQTIMDHMAPAEHVRSAKDAAGRYIGPVFEEEVRDHARPNVNRFANILEQHGLAEKGASTMSDMEKEMLRHVLTEGRDDTYVPHGETTPEKIPPNIAKAGGALRYLLDQEWERNQKVGIDVGYARNGYFPRQYDDHKIYGDEAGFKAAADKLHRVIFEQDVGDDPEKLLAAHDRLPKDVRALLDPDVQDGVKELRKNLRQQDRLKSGIEDGTAKDPVGDQAKIDDLGDAARDLHDTLRDPVRDLYAKTAAEDWFTRINAGDPTDYDHRGPNASYTAGRKLPPEADTIMRDYMVNDPAAALPRYFQQSARKIAFAKHFGVNGADLDNLLVRASKAGARGEDIQAMRRLVEAVTGKQKSGLPSGLEKATNAIHAFGSIALMPRAAWSSLSEPIAMYARTGKLKATYKAFANQLGDLVKTADSRDRADMANALGITTSLLHDSIISDRTNANYSDSPRIGKLMASYYRTTGLTQLTNSQRRSVMGAGHEAIKAWAKDFAGTNARKSRDAAAEFRNLGVPEASLKTFADWVNQTPAIPNLKDLDTEGGRLWGNVVSRLTDKVIQDPMRVDKPLMSQNPVGRLMFGLMSFNYSFFHNIVDHVMDTGIGRMREASADAKAAGAGRLGQIAAKIPAGGRFAAHAGTSVAALWAGAYVTTALREAIFNWKTVQQKSDDGTLDDYLWSLAYQRTGLNGPLDPVVQAMTGLKYERDLSGLVAGAQMSYALQNAGDMLKPLIGFGSPNTNTSDYNAIRGAYNLFATPAAAVALTSLPGGPWVRAGAGAAMQLTTGRGAADTAAEALVGPKGTGPGGKAPPTKTAPPASDKGMSGGFPVGLIDDVAGPAMKAIVPLWSRLPGPLKVGAGVAAGAAAVSALANEFGRFSEGGGDQ